MVFLFLRQPMVCQLKKALKSSLLSCDRIQMSINEHLNSGNVHLLLKFCAMPGHHPPLQFAMENSRTLRKDLRDLRASSARLISLVLKQLYRIFRTNFLLLPL
jgi:hypothetical protein